MTSSPIQIEVTSNGQRVGTIDPEQFRRYMNVPHCRPQFLDDQIAEFNAGKERAGEPERAKVIIRR